MKLLLVLSCVFAYNSLLSDAGEIEPVGQTPYQEAEPGEVIQQGGFKCPFPFGTFGDPDDCSKYYICIGGKGINRKCKRGNKFDIFRRVCLPGILAICGGNKDKDKTTTSNPITTSGKFKCPTFSGSYPHPDDCSKYYTCILFIASTRTCPENQLFDAVKSSCEPENTVNCGDRNRPGHTTSDDVTESPNTESISETEPTTETEGDDTSRETETTTHPPVTVTEYTTTTEKERLTAPPETDCNEDDVDCIIDETGDPDDWFKCPEDVGSYPHPSSNKLFIFCMNWIPSVKKCGLELVFSKELFTCIEP